jgi:hypothetical protein
MEGFTTAEVTGFKNPWATWNPQRDQPMAGRWYNPNDKYDQPPADLSRAPVSQPQGNIPTSQQRPATTPGSSSMPRDAPAQLKDLGELDNKITIWLDSASQKEREQPGSLTPVQRQRMVMLQARLADVRDQRGTGIITDSYKQVADELRELRVENDGWQEHAPSLEEVYTFGTGADPNAFLTENDFREFMGLFNTILNQFQGLTQPDPLQRVRLQQLEVMRQDLQDNAKRFSPPPIRMAAAKLYLRQMLKADQPLPTLYSMEPPAASNESNPSDIFRFLENIRWNLNVSYDPAAQDMKRAAAELIESLKSGQVSPQEARSHIATFYDMTAPVAFGSTGDNTAPLEAHKANQLIKRATKLCNQIDVAFPGDAAALGCAKRVTTEYQAETVINTVCDRLRYSVPTVSPEQFGCPHRA